MAAGPTGTHTHMCSPMTAVLAIGFLGLMLAGCFGGPLDDLDSATPQGSAFSQALYQDYAYLARSFGDLEDVDDPDGWLPFIQTVENPLRPVAEAFANKALLAANGLEPAPEPAINAASQSARTRLVPLLDQTKARFPADAARAQAQYDCWIFNSYVQSQADAADTCRRGFESAVLRLSGDLRGNAAAPVATAPTVAQSVAPMTDYTVYFDFDSWTLTPDALSTITNAVDTARAGGQSRITIVGHTDTSGSAGYNLDLSERRANVVEETMVEMGARREAILVSGVGEDDLAVQTADGVREVRNRRAVVNLIP